MAPPRTCVISVTYRGSVDTAACVRSLRESTSSLHIVVVDTTPNDPMLEPALDFDSDVTLIRATGNVGFGRANNLAIQWALDNTRCDFLFLLNNDTQVLPNTIGLLEAAMAASPNVGIMVPRIVRLNEPQTLWYGGGEIDWRRASAFTPGDHGNADAPLAMTPRNVTFATGCAMFIRRPVAQALGGFDPRFFMYEEDVELCLRAHEQGIRIRYIPASLVLHRVQGSTQENGTNRSSFWSVDNARLPFLAYHVMRNRMLNVRLHARGRNRIVAFAFLPLMILRRAIPFVLGGRFDAIAAMLKGLADSTRVNLRDTYTAGPEAEAGCSPEHARRG